MKKSYATTNYLYDAVETDVTTNGYGGTYTGDHADTTDSDGNAIVGDENIYYYNTRGYGKVKFGDWCWQIIRTTDTGGVKLIYDGTYSSSTGCSNSGSAQTIGESKFNSNTENLKYAGLKYLSSGTNYNDTDSTILAYLYSWYESNLTSYESYLEDIVFCNDRTGSTSSNSAGTGTAWVGSGTTWFYFHHYGDYGSQYQKFSCDDYRDRFTTNNSVALLKYPVGLISDPEIEIGGGCGSSKRYYANDSSYWTLSPSYYQANVPYVTVKGCGYGYSRPHSVNVASASVGVRPTISLVRDVTYNSGSGTSNSPYVVDGLTPKVKYSNNSTYGTMSGTTQEEVSSGGHPTGRNVTPNSGYTFIGWIANKNVTLSNNTTISKGTIMTKAQTQSIVVSSSITLTAKYYKGWLYDKVEQDATTNGYGSTYTGDHADSVENDGTEIVGAKNIYHYNTRGYGKVKFANMCWQIIRTTDTGGIKLIYDGAPSFERPPLNQSDYKNVTNSSSYPYTFSSSSWTSNNHSNSSSSEISFTVSSAGDYTLSYKVSSESSYDKAYFYKNGTAICDSSSGISGEKTSTCDLTGLTTSDVIKVKYTKDNSGSSGSDNVVFSLANNSSPASYSCSNTGDAQQIGTSAFNSGSNNAKYVGYKYKTTNYNDTDSVIKEDIDNWYEINLSSYESKLEDTVFCNDRTGSGGSTSQSSAATGTTWNGEGTSIFYYHNYDDTYNKLSCYDKKDRFTTNNTSAKLSHPIGLMSQPEYLLGGTASTSNVHRTGSDYWLVSPNRHYSSYASGRGVAASGVLGYTFVTDALGVRPVVSLAPNMTYISGDGTSSSPYEVEGTILEPSLTATFYYQSSSTSGTTNISSVTTSCTPSGGSCSAEIPSAVRSSVGTYNNSYAGLNTSTGSMSTPVNSSATTVTLTSDTTYYAVYRSSVTNYYYSN